MFCSKCGAKNDDGSKFCNNCGAKLIRESENKLTRLRCAECGGILEINEDYNAVMCPYCGSKHLIEESDDVKKERIRNKSGEKIAQINADRDVELYGKDLPTRIANIRNKVEETRLKREEIQRERDLIAQKRDELDMKYLPFIIIMMVILMIVIVFLITAIH